MEETIYRVYMHTCPNGKRYIGATSLKPENRWRKNGDGYKGQEKFYADIQLFGWNSIEHSILKENLTQEEAQYWEKYYIKQFNTQNPQFGYNTSAGGEYCPIGWHHSEETKRKQSESFKGENNPMYGLRGENNPNYGKKHSEETKRKQSEKMKGENNPMYGKHMSEESKRKQSESLKGKNVGKHRSEEFKEKQRQSHLGKKQSKESNIKRSESIKKLKWYTDGNEEIRVTECPTGFVPGRLKKANK